MKLLKCNIPSCNLDISGLFNRLENRPGRKREKRGIRGKVKFCFKLLEWKYINNATELFQELKYTNLFFKEWELRVFSVFDFERG